MTRYARAKGSKASNERLPEDATPWSEMKQQLLAKNREIDEKKNKQAALDQRTANYKAFLQEKEDEELKKSQWAEFPDADSDRPKSEKRKFSQIEAESEDEEFAALKAAVDKKLDGYNDDSDAPPEEQTSKVEVLPPRVKVKKIKKNKLSINIDKKTKQNETSDRAKEDSEHSASVKIKKSMTKNKSESADSSVKQKRSKKSKHENIEQSNIVENKKVKNKKRKRSEENENEEPLSKKDKKPIKTKGNTPKKTIKENLTEEDMKKIEKKKQKRIKQILKKKRLKEEGKLQSNKVQPENADGTQSPELKDNKPNNNQQDKEINKKKKIEKTPNNINQQNKFNKFKDGKTFDRFKDGKKFGKDKNGKKFDKDSEHQRRKPFLPKTMIFNGKEVAVDYVDGFPVKKEDAERLKKLRKEMISKGLPRSEINISLKLERRKAEKAFAREKKKVCFNCRKSGHNLSECPDLDKEQMVSQAGTGICFKCGSTEHTHFECKVVKGQEFKYAQCFICNEQGHISRQCPDNARGLYPKGGACRVCGDVTHLKKDCPKYQAEQQQINNSLSVDVIGDNNPDVLDNKGSFSNSNLGNRKPNKIIKF